MLGLVIVAGVILAGIAAHHSLWGVALAASLVVFVFTIGDIGDDIVKAIRERGNG